jgi:hypothetical protein
MFYICLVEKFDGKHPCIRRERLRGEGKLNLMPCVNHPIYPDDFYSTDSIFLASCQLNTSIH